MGRIHILLFGTPREDVPSLLAIVRAGILRSGCVHDIALEAAPVLADVKRTLSFIGHVDIINIANETKMTRVDFGSQCRQLASLIVGKRYALPPIVLIPDPTLCFISTVFRGVQLQTREGPVRGLMDQAVVDRSTQMLQPRALPAH